MQREEFVAVAKEIVTEIKDDDVPLLASGVAFRVFLSLFPSLIAAIAIFGLVYDPEGLSQLLANTRQVLPPDARELLGRQLERLTEQQAGGGVAVAGIAVGLWAATTAATATMRALNRAYEVEEKRDFFAARLTALALTVALFGALIALVVLLVAGGPIQDFLLPSTLEGGPVGGAITVGRLLAAIVVLMLLFAFVYWAGPNRERPAWEWFSPGAVIGVVGWLVVSGGFALYTRVAGNYAATYGTLAGVIVLLLWLYLSMFVLVAGGEVNSVLERRERERAGVRDEATPGRPTSSPPAPAAAARRAAVVMPRELPASDGYSLAARAAPAAAAAMAVAVFLGLASRARRRR